MVLPPLLGPNGEHTTRTLPHYGAADFKFYPGFPPPHPSPPYIPVDPPTNPSIQLSHIAASLILEP